ncbi:hypothetical protein ACQ5SO_01180 [Rhodovulum sp. DZ06]|uniref:hypothetical protein n=1 Tax=Rhodovulum sp. DZ06 TaxID=3425126 RepID=UPI003D33BFF2
MGLFVLVGALADAEDDAEREELGAELAALSATLTAAGLAPHAEPAEAEPWGEDGWG